MKQLEEILANKLAVRLHCALECTVLLVTHLYIYSSVSSQMNVQGY